MKHSNFLSKLGHFLLLTLQFCVFVLPIPAIIIFSICMDFQTRYFMLSPLLIPLSLAVSGLTINWFLGWACGAEFENTGYVREGRSIIEMVKDAPYYKRATYVYYSVFGLFILSIAYFLFLQRFNPTWGLIGLIASIIGAIFYFLLAKSAGEKQKLYQQSKEEFAEEFAKKEPIKQETKPKTKFKFNKHPEMLELYNSYKTAKNRSLHFKNDPNNVEEYNQQCSIRNELFEKLSKQVYEIFSPQKPDLLNKKTNEIVKWDDLFNKPYEN